MLIFILCLLLIFLIYAFIPSYTTKQEFFNKKHKDENAIYLTFDDGPSEYTEELLDLLKKYNIKASFFCVANFAKQRPEIIKKMQEEGHKIALHSLRHKNFMLQGIMQTKRDLEESLKVMQELGVDINYFRAPWGDTNIYLLNALKKRNLKLVYWHVMAEDWEGNTTKEIICKKLISRTKDGDIICLHDGRGENEAPFRTIQALEMALPIFLEKGYKFKTIDEYEI